MSNVGTSCPVCDFAFQPGDNIKECECCGLSVHEYCSEAGSDNLYRCSFCIEADNEQEEQLSDRSNL